MLTGFPWDLVGETWHCGLAPQPGGGAGRRLWDDGLHLVLFIGAAPAALASAVVRERRRGAIGARRPPARFALGDPRLLGTPPCWLSPEAPARHRRSPFGSSSPNLPEPPAWSQAVLDRAMDRATPPSRAQPACGRLAPPTSWSGRKAPSRSRSTRILAPGSLGSADRILESSLQSRARSLLSGGVRVDPGSRPAETPDGLYFNTLLALRRDPEGLRLMGVYDKHHLVPFGEYMPLRQASWRRLGIRKLVSVSADFTAGPRSRAPLQPAGPDRAAPDLLRGAVPRVLGRRAEGGARGRSAAGSTSATTPGSGVTSGPKPAPEPRQLSRHRGGAAHATGHAHRRLGGDRRARPTAANTSAWNPRWRA